MLLNQKTSGKGEKQEEIFTLSIWVEFSLNEKANVVHVLKNKNECWKLYKPFVTNRIIYMYIQQTSKDWLVKEAKNIIVKELLG